MYEHMTVDYIMERMLNQVSEEIDQREGSIIYDALMPCAIELANMYMELDMVLDEAFADTASMEYLAKRAAERGMLPNPATFACVKAKFIGANPREGLRFSCQEFNYCVVRQLEDGQDGIYYVELQCEEGGSEPNSVLGQLEPATTEDYVEGLQYAEIVDILVPGEDEEDQEVFRERYFDSFQEKAFGGNVADYKDKVHKIDGVGGVKVQPVWNGGGTVKLTIVDSEYQKPTDEFIESVQQQIDPTKDGAGTGIAPIGHVVTVVGVAEKEISVSFSITYEPDYSFIMLKPQIEAAIDDYFKEIAQNWEEETAGVVRISQMEYRMLNIDGILDVTDTKLNGNAANIILESNEIPVRGSVSG